MALSVRWMELGKALEIPEDIANEWWTIIETYYSEKHRHYHTLAHIEDMFEKFDAVKHKLSQPEAVALAIFFHDIIYEPTKPDNEEQSTELFKQFVQQSLTDRYKYLDDVVSTWILATKKHQTPEHTTKGAHGDTDLHYFLDMDMSVLGRPDQDYRQYVKEIEKEYCHMAEEAFNSGRAKVMKAFIEVPNIFATKDFRTKYEEQARLNIQTEISRREALCEGQ